MTSTLLIRRRMETAAILAKLKQTQQQLDLLPVVDGDSCEIDTLWLERVRVCSKIGSAIIKLLKHPQCSITKLELIYCQGSVDKVLQEIFTPPRKYGNKRQISIRSLSVGGHGSVTLALAKGLARYPSLLQELKLETDFSHAVALPLAQALQACLDNDRARLTKLDLTNCNLSHQAALLLAKAFYKHTTQEHLVPSSLETLILADCRLRDDEMATIIQALTTQSSLQRLSIPLNECKSQTPHAIAQLLSSSSPSSASLRYLDMSQQLIGTEKCLDLIPILTALNTNNMLKIWNVKENYLSDIQMKTFGTTLSINTTLEEINLQCDDIGNVGIQALAAGLASNTGLKRLFLKHNLFHHERAEEWLAQALEYHTQLELLDMDHHIPSPTRQQIQLYLCLNRSGRRYMTPNSIPLSYWAIILEQVETVLDGTAVEAGIQTFDLVYALLQGPALLES